MLFCSQQFLLFFGGVFAAYWALPWRAARVWLLLAASFYFYASWNQWLACVVCASATFDYLLARVMGHTESKRRRRILVALSIVANLGVLAYFKYANFFLTSLEQALRATGARVSMPVLQVLVPIGISFYTFEAINYTMDVYRRRIAAERSLANFMLFILFFPHLIAGPIVRARDFLPQIARAKRWSWARMHLGAQLFLLGVFKKLAIADRMALLADPVFGHPSGYGSYDIWIATLAYALQIYCDFSGYSDMAIGAAHMLGYKLAPNFNNPYFATNISEFWRRWHMSLSGWLRDYLFIPMGGSRCGSWRTRWNLLVTMTLGGLWHGAAWHFVIWGMMHGASLIIHREFAARCRRLPLLARILATPAGTVFRMLITFFCVAIGWVIFRAPNLAGAGDVIRRLFIHYHTGAELELARTSFWCIAALVFIGYIGADQGWWRQLIRRAPPVALGMVYGSALTAALVLASGTGSAFIYFQF